MMDFVGRPRRSALFVPGSNPRAIAKARTLPIDVVILELEDAVLPESKEAARQAVAAAIRATEFRRQEVIVRVNAPATAWGHDDLAMVVSTAPDGVLVPKISRPEDLTEAARLLSGAPDRVRLWAMMETPRAVLSALAIAETALQPGSRLEVLVMGTNDLAKETRVSLARGRAAMVPWLMTCVAAARANQLSILDGVFNGLGDEPGEFRAECEQGRDLGMDGKTLVHPGQVDTANGVFAPSESEIAWARRVVEAFAAPEASGQGAIKLDGRMVERLHLEMASRVMKVAEAVSSS